MSPYTHSLTGTKLEKAVPPRRPTPPRRRAGGPRVVVPAKCPRKRPQRAWDGVGDVGAWWVAANTPIAPRAPLPALAPMVRRDVAAHNIHLAHWAHDAILGLEDNETKGTQPHPKPHKASRPIGRTKEWRPGESPRTRQLTTA